MTSVTFPSNITEALVTRFATIPGVDVALTRPLRLVDPNGSVGVASIDWKPLDIEIRGRITDEPILGRYRIIVQTLIKGLDEQESRAVHDTLTKSIRTMVYTDSQLGLSLLALTETSSSHTERLKRWGLSTQAFSGEKLKSEYTFLSATELWFDTEVR